MTSQSRLRSLTDPELAEITEAIAERRGHDDEGRYSFPVPQAANETFAGAVLWNLSVLWQDRPLLVAFGLLGSVGYFLISLWKIVTHFLG